MVTHMTDTYELASVDTLPLKERQHVPSLRQRKSLNVDDSARLRVLVNGKDDLYPWVTVVEITPTGYVGEVSGRDIEWLPVDSRVVFTAEHVIEI